MTKRIFSAMLAVMMLLASVSCSESKTNSDETEKTASGNETVGADEESKTPETEAVLTEIEARQLIPDDLPNEQFNGRDFRVLTINEYAYEIVSEDITGDACNDAIYNRDVNIESRFDVKISCTEEGSPEQTLKTMATAGTDDYDLVGIKNYLSYVPINSKAVLNWTEIPYVDLTKPWHNELANENATINNRLFTICSDLSVTSMTFTHAIFFNVELMENFGYTSSDLYSMVKEGSWTFDKFSSMVANMYEDKNGNNVKDKEDVFGFGYYIENAADVWLSAFDQPIVSITDDNKIEVSFMCDKTISIIDKLTDFHTNNEGFFRYTTAAKEEESMFLNEKLVMAPLRFFAAYNTLREMETTYSMLPYPKWDEAQDGYYTNADDKFTAFAIPITAYNNTDFIGIIYEVLCAESYKKVYPEYYDTALKGKYSSEPETAEMVDIIMSGRDFDFSFQFGETYFVRLPYLVRDMLLNNKTNVASEYKVKEKAMKKTIEQKLLPLYTD